MQVGEAAGILAAIAVADGVTPRGADIPRVQEAIRGGGGHLLLCGE
jgi:hypothetical protein